MPAIDAESLIAQLYQVDGKADIVPGQMIPFMPSGRMPANAALEIAVSLRLHARAARLPGLGVPDGAGFIVRLNTRQWFSPDTAYYEGPSSAVGFFEGAPRFALEVRSDNDCAFWAEKASVAKQRECFHGGTIVVWNVDMQGDDSIRNYTPAGGAEMPVTVFRRIETADAEPGVPGWTISVDDLFEQ